MVSHEFSLEDATIVLFDQLGRTVLLFCKMGNVPSPSRDFERMLSKLINLEPFTFVRFSDGEMEIIRNQKLEISDGSIIWSKGHVHHSYPKFDFKNFDPGRDAGFRKLLVASAEYKSSNYIKGVPSRHNNAVADRDLMIELNGGSLSNLTFADLLINQNYLKFRKKILPWLARRESVLVIGNYRMKPENINKSWRLFAVPDGVFQKTDTLLKEFSSLLFSLPKGAIILSSASSFTNIAGYRSNQLRDDITFIDIGTSLHDLMGMESGIRQYHVLLAGNRLSNLIRKAALVIVGGYFLRW